MVSMKCIFFFLLVVTQFTAIGQRRKKDFTEDVVKINFLFPGVSYEQAIVKNQTAYIDLFVTIGTKTSNTYNSSTYTLGQSFFLIPAINGQYRFYYNGEKRRLQGKRTEKNSMNYVAPSIYHYFGNNKKGIFSTTVFGFLWGFQRNYQSSFSLDFNIGIGVANRSTFNTQNYYKATPSIQGIGDLRLGFWLNRKKNK
jgi:hypothetical protein